MESALDYETFLINEPIMEGELSEIPVIQLEDDEAFEENDEILYYQTVNEDILTEAVYKYIVQDVPPINISEALLVNPNGLVADDVRIYCELEEPAQQVSQGNELDYCVNETERNKIEAVVSRVEELVCVNENVEIENGEREAVSFLSYQVEGNEKFVESPTLAANELSNNPNKVSENTENTTSVANEEQLSCESLKPTREKNLNEISAVEEVRLFSNDQYNLDETTKNATSLANVLQLFSESHKLKSENILNETSVVKEVRLFSNKDSENTKTILSSVAKEIQLPSETSKPKSENILSETLTAKDGQLSCEVLKSTSEIVLSEISTEKEQLSSDNQETVLYETLIPTSENIFNKPVPGLVNPPRKTYTRTRKTPAVWLQLTKEKSLLDLSNQPVSGMVSTDRKTDESIISEEQSEKHHLADIERQTKDENNGVKCLPTQSKVKDKFVESQSLTVKNISNHQNEGSENLKAAATTTCEIYPKNMQEFRKAVTCTPQSENFFCETSTANKQFSPNQNKVSGNTKNATSLAQVLRLSSESHKRKSEKILNETTTVKEVGQWLFSNKDRENTKSETVWFYPKSFQKLCKVLKPKSEKISLRLSSNDRSKFSENTGKINKRYGSKYVVFRSELSKTFKPTRQDIFNETTTMKQLQVLSEALQPTSEEILSEKPAEKEQLRSLNRNKVGENTENVTSVAKEEQLSCGAFKPTSEKTLNETSAVKEARSFSNYQNNLNEKTKNAILLAKVVPMSSESHKVKREKILNKTSAMKDVHVQVFSNKDSENTGINNVIAESKNVVFQSVLSKPFKPKRENIFNDTTTTNQLELPSEVPKPTSEKISSEISAEKEQLFSHSRNKVSENAKSVTSMVQETQFPSETFNRKCEDIFNRAVKEPFKTCNKTIAGPLQLTENEASLEQGDQRVAVGFPDLTERKSTENIASAERIEKGGLVDVERERIDENEAAAFLSNQDEVIDEIIVESQTFAVEEHSNNQNKFKSQNKFKKFKCQNKFKCQSKFKCQNKVVENTKTISSAVKEIQLPPETSKPKGEEIFSEPSIAKEVQLSSEALHSTSEKVLSEISTEKEQLASNNQVNDERIVKRQMFAVKQLSNNQNKFKKFKCQNKVSDSTKNITSAAKQLQVLYKTFKPKSENIFNRTIPVLVNPSHKTYTRKTPAVRLQLTYDITLLKQNNTPVSAMVPTDRKTEESITSEEQSIKHHLANIERQRKDEKRAVEFLPTQVNDRFVESQTLTAKDFSNHQNKVGENLKAAAMTTCEIYPKNFQQFCKAVTPKSGNLFCETSTANKQLFLPNQNKVSENTRNATLLAQVLLLSSECYKLKSKILNETLAVKEVRSFSNKDSENTKSAMLATHKVLPNSFQEFCKASKIKSSQKIIIETPAAKEKWLFSNKVSGNPKSVTSTAKELELSSEIFKIKDKNISPEQLHKTYSKGRKTPAVHLKLTEDKALIEQSDHRVSTVVPVLTERKNEESIASAEYNENHHLVGVEKKRSDENEAFEFLHNESKISENSKNVPAKDIQLPSEAFNSKNENRFNQTAKQPLKTYTKARKTPAAPIQLTDEETLHERSDQHISAVVPDSTERKNEESSTSAEQIENCCLVDVKKDENEVNEWIVEIQKLAASEFSSNQNKVSENTEIVTSTAKELKLPSETFKTKSEKIFSETATEVRLLSEVLEPTREKVLSETLSAKEVWFSSEAIKEMSENSLKEQLSLHNQNMVSENTKSVTSTAKELELPSETFKTNNEDILNQTVDQLQETYSMGSKIKESDHHVSTVVPVLTERKTEESIAAAEHGENRHLFDVETKRRDENEAVKCLPNQRRISENLKNEPTKEMQLSSEMFKPKSEKICYESSTVRKVPLSSETFQTKNGNIFNQTVKQPLKTYNKARKPAAGPLQLTDDEALLERSDQHISAVTQDSTESKSDEIIILAEHIENHRLVNVKIKITDEKETVDVLAIQNNVNESFGESQVAKEFSSNQNKVSENSKCIPTEEIELPSKTFKTKSEKISSETASEKVLSETSTAEEVQLSPATLKATNENILKEQLFLHNQSEVSENTTSVTSTAKELELPSETFKIKDKNICNQTVEHHKTYAKGRKTPAVHLKLMEDEDLIEQSDYHISTEVPVLNERKNKESIASAEHIENHHLVGVEKERRDENDTSEFLPNQSKVSENTESMISTAKKVRLSSEAMSENILSEISEEKEQLSSLNLNEVIENTKSVTSPAKELQLPSETCKRNSEKYFNRTIKHNTCIKTKKTPATPLQLLEVEASTLQKDDRGVSAVVSDPTKRTNKKSITPADQIEKCGLVDVVERKRDKNNTVKLLINQNEVDEKFVESQTLAGKDISNNQNNIREHIKNGSSPAKEMQLPPETFKLTSEKVFIGTLIGEGGSSLDVDEERLTRTSSMHSSIAFDRKLARRAIVVLHRCPSSTVFIKNAKVESETDDKISLDVDYEEYVSPETGTEKQANAVESAPEAFELRTEAKNLSLSSPEVSIEIESETPKQQQQLEDEEMQAKTTAAASETIELRIEARNLSLSASEISTEIEPETPKQQQLEECSLSHDVDKEKEAEAASETIELRIEPKNLSLSSPEVSTEIEPETPKQQQQLEERSLSHDVDEKKLTRVGSYEDEKSKKRGAKETPKQFEKRLKVAAISKRKRIANETPEERERRRKTYADWKRERLAKETPEERKERLTFRTLAARRLRELKRCEKCKKTNETLGKCERCRKTFTDWVRKRIANEAPDERARRRKTFTDWMRKRLANETPEERARRRKTFTDWMRKRLANETPEECQRRRIIFADCMRKHLEREKRRAINRLEDRKLRKSKHYETCETKTNETSVAKEIQLPFETCKSESEKDFNRTVKHKTYLKTKKSPALPLELLDDGTSLEQGDQRVSGVVSESIERRIEKCSLVDVERKRRDENAADKFLFNQDEVNDEKIVESQTLAATLTAEEMQLPSETLKPKSDKIFIGTLIGEIPNYRYVVKHSQKTYAKTKTTPAVPPQLIANSHASETPSVCESFEKGKPVTENEEQIAKNDAIDHSVRCSIEINKILERIAVVEERCLLSSSSGFLTTSDTADEASSEQSGQNVSARKNEKSITSEQIRRKGRVEKEAAKFLSNQNKDNKRLEESQMLAAKDISNDQNKVSEITTNKTFKGIRKHPYFFRNRSRNKEIINESSVEKEVVLLSNKVSKNSKKATIASREIFPKGEMSKTVKPKIKETFPNAIAKQSLKTCAKKMSAVPVQLITTSLEAVSVSESIGKGKTVNENENVKQKAKDYTVKHVLAAVLDSTKINSEKSITSAEQIEKRHLADAKRKRCLGNKARRGRKSRKETPEERFETYKLRNKERRAKKKLEQSIDDEPVHWNHSTSQDVTNEDEVLSSTANNKINVGTIDSNFLNSFAAANTTTCTTIEDQVESVADCLKNCHVVNGGNAGSLNCLNPFYITNIDQPGATSNSSAVFKEVQVGALGSEKGIVIIDTETENVSLEQCVEQLTVYRKRKRKLEVKESMSSGAGKTREERLCIIANRKRRKRLEVLKDLLSEAGKRKKTLEKHRKAHTKCKAMQSRATEEREKRRNANAEKPRQRKANEVIDQVEKRLNDERIAYGKWFEKLMAEVGEIGSSSVKEKSKDGEGDRTAEEREKWLKDYLESYKRNETPEQREINRWRMANETTEEREKRLALKPLARRKRNAREAPGEREQHLANPNIQEQIEDETPEQLQPEIEKQKMRKESETAEELQNQMWKETEKQKRQKESETEEQRKERHRLYMREYRATKKVRIQCSWESSSSNSFESHADNEPLDLSIHDRSRQCL